VEEVKKVRKIVVKILVPVLALLMLLSMASCVKACLIPQPTKTPITAVIVTSVTDYTTVKYVVNNHIEYLLYAKLSGTLALYQGTYGYTNLPSTPFAIVSYVDTCWGTYNIVTNMGSYTFYEVWTISSAPAFVGFDHPVLSTGDLLGGTTGITGYPGWTAVSSHIIVYGIGAYARQVIDVASPNLYTAPWTGYWQTP